MFSIKLDQRVIESGEFKAEVSFDKLSASHLVVSWLLAIEVSSKI